MTQLAPRSLGRRHICAAHGCEITGELVDVGNRDATTLTLVLCQFHEAMLVDAGASIRAPSEAQEYAPEPARRAWRWRLWPR